MKRGLNCTFLPEDCTQGPNCTFPQKFLRAGPNFKKTQKFQGETAIRENLGFSGTLIHAAASKGETQIPAQPDLGKIITPNPEGIS